MSRPLPRQHDDTSGLDGLADSAAGIIQWVENGRADLLSAIYPTRRRRCCVLQYGVRLDERYGGVSWQTKEEALRPQNVQRFRDAVQRGGANAGGGGSAEKVKRSREWDSEHEAFVNRVPSKLRSSARRVAERTAKLTGAAAATAKAAAVAMASRSKAKMDRLAGLRVPTAQRSVWERILASPARVCMYLKANNFVGKCNGRLPGRPAAIERAVVAAAHAGRRGPRACDFACAAAAWRSLRDRCARWRRRTRIPRGAFRSCVRTRARSRAPRRAPPSLWTTACARRPDSPRQPGTVPVPL